MALVVFCSWDFYIGSVAYVVYFFFFFNDTATTEIYTYAIVGSVRMCIRDRVNGSLVGHGELVSIEDGYGIEISSWMVKE
ncbi:hypothetical protein SGP16002_42450 [Shigella flexneri]|nr:hypothetical protein SGP16002_42450 [Shigella flexneri]